MNEAELIAKVHEKTSGVYAVSKSVLLVIAKLIAAETQNALRAGEDAPLFGLGKLKPAVRKERLGHNPRTGEAVLIPEKRAVVFAPSSALKKAINT